MLNPDAKNFQIGDQSLPADVDERKPAYVTDPHVSDAQRLMEEQIELEIARLLAKKNIQDNLGGSLGYLPTALAQAQEDQAAIAKIAGLKMSQPDKDTVVITGTMDGLLVDVKGRLEVTRGVESCLQHPAGKTIKPQLIEVGGTIGDREITGPGEIAPLKHFLERREKIIARLKKGVPPHLSA